jgi:two-component system, OmpR family, sensor histidine kinase BaeS
MDHTSARAQGQIGATTDAGPGHSAGDEPGGATAQEARAALERQSQLRHDLRAPLAVMLPLISLMRDGGDPLTERQLEHLAVLERQVERMAGMIESAADSGWFDCCAAPAVLVHVPLGELVAELAVAPQWNDEPGAPLRISSTKDLAPALADRDRVRQILADLVGNARRYAGRGPIDVIVEPGSSPRTLALVVADGGPGIPADELPHVAEFGYRGAAARALAPGGLGLGLWICRRLAEAMGGGLTVVSTPDVGTSVTVLLPAAW